MYNYISDISYSVVQFRLDTNNLYLPPLIEPPHSLVLGQSKWTGKVRTVTNKELVQDDLVFTVPDARRNDAYNGRDIALSIIGTLDVSGDGYWLVNPRLQPAGLYQLEVYQERTGFPASATLVSVVLVNFEWEADDPNYKTVTDYKQSPTITMYEQ